MRLILFGTVGCHLCEQAEQIIGDCLSGGFEEMAVDHIDIAEDEQWQQLYAIRIPVLYHPGTAQELAWPFGPAEVKEFILCTIETSTLRPLPETAKTQN